MTEWINVKEKLPDKDDAIVYCNTWNLIATVGRYCGIDDPMPSAPSWLPWSSVTHWMLLPETPEET